MHIASKDPIAVLKAVTWFISGPYSAYEKGDRVYINQVEFCDNCSSEVESVNTVSIDKSVAERVLDVLEIDTLYKFGPAEIVPTEQGYCCTDCWQD